MKYVLLIAGILITYMADAQDNNYMELLNRSKKPFLQKPLPKIADLIGKNNSWKNFKSEAAQGRVIGALSNGTIIYTLPQDGMPCLKPDMNQFNMPNAGRNTRIFVFPEPGAIPNPGYKI